MPELPEVETVRRGLASFAEGKRIAQVTVRNRSLRQPVANDFERMLKNVIITQVSRRAKYLLIGLSNDTTLLIHLGMSGSLVVHVTPPMAYEKHDHVILALSDGSVIVYRDPRRFGLMLCISNRDLVKHSLLAHLGPEPLAKEWKATDLFRLLQNRKAPVKAAIMDQSVVVGVGNIYACEALFASGIHPARPACKVTKAETSLMFKNIRKVLEAAIASGGSTLRDYVRSSGDSGYFQHHFTVYGRQNLPCFRCNTPIAAMRQSGRSSFFCPTCQH